MAEVYRRKLALEINTPTLTAVTLFLFPDYFKDALGGTRVTMPGTAGVFPLKESNNRKEKNVQEARKICEI